MSTSTGTTPQGPIPAIGIPNSQDYPRLVFTAPRFEQVPLAELIEPAVLEATESLLPSLVPPYVNDAADAAVQAQAVLLAGSTMTGPLYLNPTLPTQPSQAASMAYVDMMTATGQVPDVPPVPANEIWGRQTGPWTPIAADFLPLAGGQISGQLSVGGATTLNGPVTFGSPVTLPPGSTGAFLPLGGGTVGPTVLTNVSYNLLASGAHGDGVTDDTAAIQTFLNSLPAGAEVILPATHQFLIDSASLTIPAGLTIRGQGAFTENPAGVGNLIGPAFILNPAHSLVPQNAVRLTNFKVLRKGLRKRRCFRPPRAPHQATPCRLPTPRALLSGWGPMGRACRRVARWSPL
jgi:hypothetical protein